LTALHFARRRPDLNGAKTTSKPSQPAISMTMAKSPRMAILRTAQFPNLQSDCVCSDGFLTAKLMARKSLKG